jgi:hypothetical protein
MNELTEEMIIKDIRKIYAYCESKNLGENKLKFLREAFHIAIECTKEGDPFVFYDKWNHNTQYIPKGISIVLEKINPDMPKEAIDDLKKQQITYSKIALKIDSENKKTSSEKTSITEKTSSSEMNSSKIHFDLDNINEKEDIKTQENDLDLFRKLRKEKFDNKKRTIIEDYSNSYSEKDIKQSKIGNKSDSDESEEQYNGIPKYVLTVEEKNRILQKAKNLGMDDINEEDLENLAAILNEKKSNSNSTKPKSEYINMEPKRKKKKKGEEMYEDIKPKNINPEFDKIFLKYKEEAIIEINKYISLNDTSKKKELRDTLKIIMVKDIKKLIKIQNWKELLDIKISNIKIK